MNEIIDNKSKKYLIAVGVVNLFIAAMCIGCAITVMVYFVELIITPVAGLGTILFLFAGVFRLWIYIAYAIAFFISAAFAVMSILSGISLLKRSDMKKTKSALTLSLICGVIILTISIYPFIINTCRIIAHGYKQEYCFGFWLGLVAFILSTLCIVLNRIAASKCKSGVNGKML